MYYYLALLFVLIINCCMINNPKSQLKTANIYSYTVCECQESESGLAEQILAQDLMRVSQAIF